MMPMHNKIRLSFKKLFLFQASVLLTACTQMPQLNTADSSIAQYDSNDTQGISIDELLANARNNTVANPEMSNLAQTPNKPNLASNQALSANKQFALALEREKMRTLLNQARQTEENEALISQYQAFNQDRAQSETPPSVSLTPDTDESQVATISITKPVEKQSFGSPSITRDKGLNLYHRQRKAKEQELKSYLITLSFQTNSADIDTNLEQELDHFSRLHYREQLVINCAISTEEDTQQAYETAMIRCLSIETFFKQRNHITMSQVLVEIKPNQVLIFSDGQGF